MKSLIKILIFGLGLVFVSANTAQAALVDRGGGMIYDTDLNITWMANANGNGMMTWHNALIWADNLTYGGYTDWRLPTTLQPDSACQAQGAGGDSYGYNCIGSEMGHLFYTELGGTAASSIFDSTDPDLALFTNIQPYWYWSSTEYALDPSHAWTFGFTNSFQGAANKGFDTMVAWAVRPGDVAAVPIPAAAWLFGSGLLGLLGIARRKKQ